MTNDALLTIPQVADRLGLAESTVRRKIRQRQIRTVKLGPGEKAPVRIEARELRRFIVKAHLWAPDDHKEASRATGCERSAA